MHIHSLELNGFMLHKKFKRIFGDKQIIGLVGPNRSGKTSILEGIFWILFGVSRAERDVELINKDAKKVLGKLVLDDNGKKITITRGRDRKNNGLLEIHGIEKTREAQTAINELIGYNKDEFPLTAFFLQTQINNFMELRSAEKKRYLMQWLKNTHWIVLEKAVLGDIKEENNKLLSVKSKLQVLKEDGISLKDTKSEMAYLTKKSLVKEKKKIRLEKQLLIIKTNKNLSENVEEELITLKQEEKERQRRTSIFSEEKEKLAALLYLANEKDNKIKDLDEEKLRNKRAKFISEIKDLGLKISRADNDMTGTCPILNEACDRIECNSKQVKRWRIGRKSSIAAQAYMDGGLALIKGYQEATEALRKQQTVVDKAKVGADSLKPLRAKIKVLEAKRITNESSQARDLKNRIDALNKKIIDASEQIGGLATKIDQIIEVKKRVKDLEITLLVIQKRITHLRYVAFMFGKNGIPSQEIENAFDEIEDEVNFLLQRLNTKLQIQFNPDRELPTWEDYCVQCGWQFPKGTKVKECEECGNARLKKRKDELQLRVVEDGIDSGFYMESGGGKTLVSLAIRLSLILLKQRQSNSKLDTLFLDEPDASFDESNRKAFIQLITKTLIKELKFKQIFWISHSPQITEAIPHVLSVKNCGGYSKTKWVQ